MKHHFLIVLCFSFLAYAADNSIVPSPSNSRYSRIQRIEQNTRVFAAGATRGAYEAVVGTALVTVPALHYAGHFGLHMGVAAGSFLSTPHAVKLTKLWSLYNDLQAQPDQQDWIDFATREDAELAAALPNRVYEIGFITGSLATVIASYKLLQMIPEDQRERWLIGGITLGAAAWLTKDFGRNMRL
ncbi:MAG: hypothetical protein WD055_02750 [Candidatus Dependentiae bacterium]